MLYITPTLTEEKAEAGVCAVEGSALGEMEEKDSREAPCSTQSSAVHHPLCYTFTHPTLL